MTQRLTGKTAFITAAGQGIGRATAIAFSQQGARVIATDINRAALESLRAEIDCSTHLLDVTDAAAVIATAEATGPVNVLFNAAGFVHAGHVLDCSEDDWVFAFDVNSGQSPAQVEAGFAERQPMGRLGRVEEIAALAVYLASDESSFTTGTAQIIDGGWSS